MARKLRRITDKDEALALWKAGMLVDDGYNSWIDYVRRGQSHLFDSKWGRCAYVLVDDDEE